MTQSVFDAKGRQAETLTPMAACKPITFSMSCPAHQAYLLIGDSAGNGRSLHQMEPADRDHWRLTLKLRDGSYRYRYYANQGSVTTYIRADEADDLPAAMDGADATINVS